MKKQFTLLMLGVIPTIIWGQPTINNAENFSIGTILNFQECSSATVNPGNSGANQTWNFSTLISSGTISTEQMLTPASTTNGSLFPTSNLVEQYSNGTFVYVNSSADSSFLVGYVDTVGNSVIYYPDPVLFALRPITYGNIIIHTFSDIYSSAGYNYNGHGISTINADGYGTLILPNGTYSNVLRLKITQVENDTIVPSGTISNTTTISYVWFDGIHTSALLKIDSTQSGTFSFKSVEYLLNETYAGVKEIGSQKNFGFFPNPATNQLSFTSIETGELSVTNNLGEIVLQTSIKDKQTFISTEHLKPGIYYLSFQTKDNKTTSELIIQR